VIKYLFFVTVTAEDGYSEPFGEVELHDYPFEGDVVVLRWLSGRRAYEAEVLKVDHDGMELQVRRV
jgi:hypothetical protein